jgi:hypothetical protein
LVCFASACHRNLIFTYKTIVLLQWATESRDHFFTFAFNYAIQRSAGYNFVHHLTFYLLSGGNPTAPPEALQLASRSFAELQQLCVLRCWQIAPIETTRCSFFIGFPVRPSIAWILRLPS